MEGPGVLLIKEKLSFIRDKIILDVNGNTKENKELLIGKRVLDIKSFGKKLIFEFDDFYLIIHFLMYGSFRINEKRENKRERLSIVINNSEINFYNTSIKIIKRDEFYLDQSIDIMSENFDKLKAKNKIKNSKKIISDILLDQGTFAGVGNIIKNEALFRANVHPLSIGEKIEEEYIDNLIEKVLSFSYEFYLVRKFNKRLKNHLLIYGKKICSIDGEKIKLKYIGETKRKTYFCESCQRLFV
ncbi:MAG: hypothetical protein N3D74_06060 [Caldisericia bacterium]|nr:hypothetical protein [Caldisericia bacterium]